MPPREPDQEPQPPGLPQQLDSKKTKLAKGWTNSRGKLGYDTCFKRKDGDAKERILEENKEFKDLEPVYANPESSLFIIKVIMKAGENRYRYYVWNDISDELFELPGSLDEITKGLSEPAGPAAT